MRLFLAIRLPDAAIDCLRGLQDRLRPLSPGWRWVRASNVHLTIRFLGQVDPVRERELRPAWERAARQVPAFRLTLGPVGCFPPGARPRVLWVGAREADGGHSLQALADAVEIEARLAGFAPEQRSFRPHLTLARAPRNRPVVAPAPREPLDTPPIRVETLILFQSELDPAGARYTARSSFALIPAPDGT